MEKLTAFLLAIVLFAITHAASLPNSYTKARREDTTSNAHQLLFHVGDAGQFLSLMALSRISVKDFETLRGRKLGLFGRLGFKLGQKRLQRNIAADGSIKSKFIEQLANGRKSVGQPGFHAGGFFLGLFFLWFGLIAAYVIKDDQKKNRVKWAWIGFGVSASVLLAIILSWASR